MPILPVSCKVRPLFWREKIPAGYEKNYQYVKCCRKIEAPSKGDEDEQETPGLELALTWLAAKGDKTKAKSKAESKNKVSKKKASTKKNTSEKPLGEIPIIVPEPADSQIDTES